MSAIRFLDNNGAKIIVASYYKDFYIYAEDGELERKVMILEECGYIYSVAINYITKRILVKTWRESESTCLCSFSETGELNDNIYLGSKEDDKDLFSARVISNRQGAVALVKSKRVIFLQL